MNLDYDDLLEVIGKDIPLSFCFKLKDKATIVDRLKAAGLPRANNPKWEAARLSVYAEAVKAYPTKRWISYSRNRNGYYGFGKRYFGTAYNYERVIDAVDQGAKCGLLENKKETCYSSRQSTFRATPELVRLFRDADYAFQFFDEIRLRKSPPDEGGRKWKTGKGWTKVKRRSQLVGYADDADTHRMRAEVQTINEFLGRMQLALPDALELQQKDVLSNIGRYVEFDDRCLLITPLRMFRSFCRGTFDCGGRAYGWWQQLSKDLRSQILLEGETVAEPDFSQLHATILYAQRGLCVPGDAYTVPGHSRDTIKKTFQMIVNARTTQAAIGAVQKELKAANLQHDKTSAARIVRAVKAAHPKIKDDFASDKGVKMMRTDSDIIVMVMLTLVNENIPFLPVHDSIICRQRDVEHVMKVMEDSFLQVFPGFPCKVKC